MIQASALFAKQSLNLSGFKAGALSGWVISVWLTAFSRLLEGKVVILEPLFKQVNRFGKGVLIIDDTANPKYGLNQWRRKLKIIGPSGYADGYKILLFLLFANLELVSAQSVYQTAQAVISGQIQLEDILNKRLFQLC